jgi:hypothetical protein
MRRWGKRFIEKPVKSQPYADPDIVAHTFT